MTVTELVPAEPETWVFAYGSLMWRPGFDAEDVHRATLVGYRRCFCIYSVHHRGSHQRPGLVLGLDRGGRCKGLAYKIAGCNSRAVMAYLTAREQINGVYRQARVAVTLDDGNEVDAISFIAETAHPSYAGRLPVGVQARLIRAARGQSGTNFDYLASTLEHLAALGLRERELERVAAIASPFFSRGVGTSRAKRAVGLVAALRGSGVGAPVMSAIQRRRFGYRIK